MDFPICPNDRRYNYFTAVDASGTINPARNARAYFAFQTHMSEYEHITHLT